MRERTHRSPDAEQPDDRRAGRPQGDWGLETDAAPRPGLAPTALDDDGLHRELAQLHATRNTTLRHGSDDSLAAHTARTTELEDEYLRRNPAREIDPQRLRSGARQR